MKVSFDKSNDAGASAPVPTAEQPSVALARIEPSAVAPRDNFMAADFVPGFADIKMAKLNIVQGLGDLKDSFPLGAVVYDQKLAIFEPAMLNKEKTAVTKAATAPVNITVLARVCPTRYVEKVENNNERGMLVDSEDAVRNVGGTLDWKEWDLKKSSGMKWFQPMADLIVAVARPEFVKDDDTVFSFPVGSDKYAIAIWQPKATAFVAACREVLFPAKRFNILREGFPVHSWNLSTRLKKFQNGNETWVPVLTPRVKSSPEFLTFAKEILG